MDTARAQPGIGGAALRAAHLKTAVALDQAGEMSNIARAIEQQFATPPRPRVVVRIVGSCEWLVRDARPPVRPARRRRFLLLIACTNVANLFAGRAIARQREKAIRGARVGRWRLIRQFLTSVVLSLLGGSGCSSPSGRRLGRVGRPAEPTARGSDRRCPGAGLTIVLSVVTGLLFGPRRPSGCRARRDGAQISGLAGPSSRFFNLLVSPRSPWRSCLAGAGLLVKSFVRLTSVDPGFRPDSILTVSVTLPEASYSTPREMRKFATDAIGRLRGVPGVVRTGAVNWLPLSGRGLSGSIVLEDVPQFPRGLWTSKPAVSAEYFEAMAIPLRRGPVHGPRF